MASKSRAPKYANPKGVVKGGFRRVSKLELKQLGYSTRSALYTKEGVSNPTKFLTRADIRKVQEPALEKELQETFHFARLKKERIKAARRKLFRYTYAIYMDFMRPLTLEQSIGITRNFLEFLEKKHRPIPRNQIGIIYRGVDDDFSIQPVLWRNRTDLILDKLKKMLRKYKAKMQIIYILGWIEQTS